MNNNKMLQQQKTCVVAEVKIILKWEKNLAKVRGE
jgi:hypothetical protein